MLETSSPGMPPRDREEEGARPRDRYKRPFDIAAISMALVLLLPLWAILALVIPVAIWLEDRGPVLYLQPRLGHGGRVFYIMKYRTMIDGAERATGPVLASKGDSRRTRVGRVLRRVHMDELPQIVNVLRGDMSLVGPRPERPELAKRIESEIPIFSRRLAVRPGIMGLAQGMGAYDLDARNKLRYDLLYIANMSPWLDLKLCLLCLMRASGIIPPRKPPTE